jgi:Tfp pilus assembly protein PilO
MAGPGKKNDVFAQLSKQSSTVKLGLLFLAVMLIGAAYWQFFLKDLRSSKKAEEQNRTSLMRTQLGLNTRIDTLVKQRVKLDNLKAEVDSIDFALPAEPELNSFIERLQKLAGNANVEFKSYTQGKEVQVDKYMKVPLAVSVQGDYFALLKFFLSVAPEKGEGKEVSGDDVEGNRIITIEDLALGDPEIQNDQVVLTANFTAATFHQVPAEMPAPAPGKAPAGGKTPTPTPGATGAAPARRAPGAAPSTGPPRKPSEFEAEVEAVKGQRVDTVKEAISDPKIGTTGGPGGKK